MILVTGATGMLGGEICRLLVHPSAAASREALETLGVEMVEGDVRDRKPLAAA